MKQVYLYLIFVFGLLSGVAAQTNQNHFKKGIGNEGSRTFLHSLYETRPAINQHEVRKELRTYHRDQFNARKGKSAHQRVEHEEEEIAGGELALFSTSSISTATTSTTTSYNQVPDSLELKALKALYLYTGGANWTNNSLWPTAEWPDPDTVHWEDFAEWYGIDVEYGDIENLKLAQNNLRGIIPEEIRELKGLGYLDIRGNAITALPSSIGSLLELQMLYASDNQLTIVPPGIGALTKLEILEFDRNAISALPPEIGSLLNLRYLYLSGNKLKSLPNTLGGLTSLTIFNIDRNELLSLPPSIGDIPNLGRLALSYNQLDSLPSEIGNLANLEDLVLNNNQLRELPATFSQLSYLYYLNLDGNKFYSFPLPVLQLFDLNTLKLSDNYLESIPAGISNLQFLYELALANNNFTQFPEEVLSLTYLMELNLIGNSIASLPAEIDQMQELTFLFLNDNQLSSLPTNLQNLPYLWSLFLAGNDFSDFPSSVLSLKELMELDVARSGLTSLPANLRDSLYNLYFLDISGNALDFGDLEPFFSAPGAHGFDAFSYAPQADVAGDTLLMMPVGSDIEYLLAIGGIHNEYSWQRMEEDSSWVAAEGDTTNLGKRAVTKEDQGTYRLQVSNSMVPGLTLHSGNVKLDIYYQNYVLEENIFVKGIQTLEGADQLSIGEKSSTWQYYDGLQRPIQTIAAGVSPTGKDLVQPYNYNGMLRQSLSYLPYTVATPVPGYFRAKAINGEQKDFYANPPLGIPAEDKPYSTSVFENSPLNRLEEQSGVGKGWAIESGRTSRQEYGTNEANEVLHFKVVNGSLKAVAYYLPNELSKVTAEGPQGAKQLQYTNKLGQLILAKTEVEEGVWTETYSVYDSYGNVIYELSPIAVAEINSFSGFPRTVGTERLAELCFQYKYDKHGRLVEEKAPGIAPVYYVYDRWDRLVLSQDGNQRLQNQWSFVKYDSRNRPLISGYYEDGRSRTELATQLASLTDAERFEVVDTAFEFGYSQQTFPATGTEEVLMVSYYDDYRFLSRLDSTYHYSSTLAEMPETAFPLVTGLETASMSRVIGTDKFLWNVSYYDQELRQVQGVGTNHLGSVNRASSSYNFAGQLTSSRISYFEGDTLAQVSMTRSYTYDHAGRLMEINHQVNEQDEVLLASMKYNELGQLMEKNLHSVNGSLPLQSVDYGYNIQGWLTAVNSADISQSDDGDFFGFELAYEQALPEINNTPQYNGNISAALWSSGMDTVTARGYAYGYDKGSRLRSAAHHIKAPLDWSASEAYSVDSLRYDGNGNIQQLSRNDGAGKSLDALRYTYEGNQLLQVEDAGNKEEGFKDGNESGRDYGYDANGNLAYDRNLGIDSIYYNVLNKTDSLVFSNGVAIKYLYDARGTKLAQKIYENDTIVSRTDYVGELLLHNGAIQQIQHEEGRLVASATSGEWVYQYHLKDQLGNVRLTFTSEPQTETSMATMESESAQQEESQYLKLEESRISTIAEIDHTGGGTPEVTRLNGYHGITDGPARFLRVMPGDTVKMKVYAKYLDLREADTKVNANAVLAAIAGVGSIGMSPGDPGQMLAASQPGVGAAVAAAGRGKEKGAPKAFLNYYLFDNAYNLIDAGFVQVSEEAAIDPARMDAAHEELSMEVAVEEPGYLMTNLSYDEPSNADVYFDDYTVTHAKGQIVQMQDYYPYGLAYNKKIQENEILNKYLYQGKEVQDSTGWHDFHARLYSPALGRFLGADPAGQFHSPYLAMGNNPVIGVDPDGEWVNFVIGAVVGGIGGYSTGKALGKSGWDLFGYTIAGAGIGAATAGIGSAVTAATSATLGATGSILAGGTVAGAFNGAAMAGLGGGNIGQGALYGSIGGLAGSTASLANVQGIVPGALYGAGTGGLISGGTSSLSGGSFGDGFRSGAISGGILGGIGGGIAAKQSVYERNILFGGVTESGKQHFVDDLISHYDAHGKGVNEVILDNSISGNGATRGVIDGQEVDLDVAYLNGQGTRSNIYLKYKGRGLRGIESTFKHELVHATDLFTGYATRFYRSHNNSIIQTNLHLELRGYRANLEFGYRRSYYRNIIEDIQRMYNLRFGSN